MSFCLYPVTSYFESFVKKTTVLSTVLLKLFSSIKKERPIQSRIMQKKKTKKKQKKKKNKQTNKQTKKKNRCAFQDFLGF